MTLTQLKTLSLITKEVREFNISSFKNLKELTLNNFSVIILQPVQLLNIVEITLKKVKIEACNLEIIFKYPLLNTLTLLDVNIMGDLKDNISINSLVHFWIKGDYDRNQWNRILEALEGSAKTLCRIDCSIEIPNTPKLTKLLELMSHNTLGNI
jgi:hypothetical protein